TFEACSGFTRIAARKIAQLPKATFVTRLRSSQSPGQTARQLPDPSTLIRVESSSTRETRLQGAHREKNAPTASCARRATIFRLSEIPDPTRPLQTPADRTRRLGARLKSPLELRHHAGAHAPVLDDLSIGHAENVAGGEPE